MIEPVQIVADEVKFHQSGTDFYEFDNDNQTDYAILFVWGWVNRIEDFGPIRYTFVKDVDYELFNDGIRWISGDMPSAPPSYMGLTRIPFYISYSFRRDLSAMTRSYIYPFIREGVATMFLDGIANQGDRLHAEQDRVSAMRQMLHSSGEELDLLAAWYNANRLSGESDRSFRSRNQNFLSVYLSSGTKTAIADIIEGFTGTRPEIRELWQNTSYWNYNPEDTSIVYYWTSKTESDPQEPVFRWWDYTFQLATFYVILDLDVITTYGIAALKTLINSSKASGVLGYLGYLVDETFSAGNDDNWEPQTNVKGETSVPTYWTVDATYLDYIYTSAGTHPSGMSVISDEHFIGCDDWDDYVVMAYCENATGTDSNNIKVGVVTRWDESTGEFYFFGMCTNNDNYYVYKYESSTWTLISNGALSVDKDTKYHFRIVMEGSGAKFYIDNNLIYESSSAFNEISTGRPGFAVIAVPSTESIGKFDDMTVVV